MSRLFTHRILMCSTALLLMPVLAACQTLTSPPDEKLRTETVLDAQYAAVGKPKPMHADEADRIYEEYLKGIGEKRSDDYRGSQQ
ncbi:MAG: hypothetical protein WD034_09300 [Parvibaculum sp.]|uniref:hypothetical protein n=1 Tax=Parvibaculum sp. TaxID=2024848 RepID=UPI0034A022ED